jgi:hypothetical protein
MTEGALYDAGITSSGERQRGDTVRDSIEFRQAVERLRDACLQRGFDLPTATAEEFMASVVHEMAGRLREKEQTVVRTYLDGIDVSLLADDLVQARSEQSREIADASPAVIDVESTGRLVASLAQAVRCVSLNHDQLADESNDKWHAVGVLDDASNCLTLIGEAIGKQHTAPQGVSVFWSDESVVYARRALSRTITNLRSGAWSFGHGGDMDNEVVARMQTDLGLLPER